MKNDKRKRNTEKKKHRLVNIIPSAIIILITVIIAFRINSLYYHAYSTGTEGVSINYEKAKVLDILEENLKKSESQPQILVGTQTLKVKLLSGRHKGETVTASNSLSTDHSVVAKKGHTLIIIYDILDSGEYSVRVFNYYRAPYIYLLSFIFFASLVLIGRKKGLMSALSLVYTIICVLFIFLPLVAKGYSPVGSAILFAVMATTASMLFINGFSIKSLCAIAGTTCGVVMAGLILLAFTALMHLSGFNTDEAENLILISQTTGLQVKDLLFAGILIASLGAVMDISMSIVSSMQEIHLNTKHISRSQLLKAGINVGRDMIGTMSNTLILAFAGSSLTLMIMMYSYSVQYNQLINMNTIGIEIVQALSGSIAVILTVPLTAVIAANFLTSYPER